MSAGKNWDTNLFEKEEQFQAAAIMMLSKEFPKLRGRIFHCKNESSLRRDSNETEKQFRERCQREGGRNKAIGVLSGVHDILCVWKGILYKCELKQPGGSPSFSQTQLHDLWDSDSPIKTTVAYTLQEVYDWAVGVINCQYDIW